MFEKAMAPSFGKINFLVFLSVVIATYGEFIPTACGFQDENNQESIEKIKIEAANAWERGRVAHDTFIKSNSNWEVIWRVTRQELLKQEANNSISYTKKQIGKTFGLVVIDDRRHEVFFFNPQYAAALRRRQPAGQWLISVVEKIPPGFDFSELESLGRDFEGASYLGHNFHPQIQAIGGCPHEDGIPWFELDGFKIEEFEKKNLDEYSVMKMRCTYNSSRFNENTKRVEVFKNLVTAEFDIQNDWSLIRSGSKNRSGVIDQFEFKYQEMHGMRFCIGSERKILSDKGGAIRTLLGTWEIRKKTASPSDFTLTAFGFKEPDWYQPPRPWWLYSSLIGMGLLVIGAIVLRYGKSLWNQH